MQLEGGKKADIIAGKNPSVVNQKRRSKVVTQEVHFEEGFKSSAFLRRCKSKMYCGVLSW